VLAAPALAQGVKVGVLNDQSGVYADYGGKWSYKAALIAVEEFGGSVLGQKIELVTAGTRTSRIAPPPLRAAGTTPRALT
jgi:branched-chain amino acid transport system substrate-binding protein